MYRCEKWKEEVPVLRSYDRDAVISLINAGLALRPRIEEILSGFLEEGVDSVWFIGVGGTYASCMQAHTYAKHRTSLPVYCENAAEFLTTGNRLFSDHAVVIYSSESGTTKEMVELDACLKEQGVRRLAFVDTPDTPLAEEDKRKRVITSRKNEQLKFFLCIHWLMYRRGEFEDYAQYCENMETYLAEALAETEESADDWARRYARDLAEFRKEHPEMPHYFAAAGNQYGAAYSYGMCYWEEQLWIRTRVISCADFFHGMQEIIDRDTPVTLFIGEDEQRPLAERVARFLPKVCANYTVIDTAEFPLTGIRPEYRGSVSHLVMRAVCSRIDAYLEYYLRHPMTIRRYYRQFEY